MYGCVFEVRDSESSVRPWNAPSNAITAGRFVYARANLTAFSTASVPALKNAALVGAEIGDPLEQPLGKRDVRLVRNDREVGVGEALELLTRGGDDPRVRVADVETADAAGEVDEPVAVDVGERRAACLCRNHGEERGERRRDHALLAREDLQGTRPGHAGTKLDRAGHGHEATISEALAGPT